MSIDILQIAGPKLSTLKMHGDERGFFTELFREKDHSDIGFIQDNVSLSAEQGTVRGLHFQKPPFAQAKLITVLRGAVLDVAVDIRRGSPTFGRAVAVKLTGARLEQLYIPPGFAHGFCTLQPDTLVTYKVNAYYSPQHDCGILWNDPDLDLDWPVRPEEAILSPRDLKWPRLAEIESPFVYQP